MSSTSRSAEPFNGIRRAYALLFLYLIEVIEEIGTDRALEALQRAAERQADIVAEELRRGMPHGLGPFDSGLEAYSRFMADAGADVEIHRRNGSSATAAVRRCPFYEALLDVGVDCGYFLGGLCSHLTLPAIQSTLKRFDPRLKLEAEVMRQSAEEICLERIELRGA
ncbi:hypothetical protein AC482_04590 [miscellaneous Crenarchaeota group-15 archaeon DG-45]|uniref:Uncharacterized protein n=1 Tax=miscellaneous Crenarchaeota group-15 archaeon DG-45 TaxID=1685127 RepID=A0A0M0BNX5_9ARCH|nr:MAG: hypothetical protein AC482_04590 [miscellaneous Crenarchaeota group-15 archaeon DG-45]